MTAPSLSTVRLPLREMGRRGFEHVDRVLAGEPLAPSAADRGGAPRFDRPPPAKHCRVPWAACRTGRRRRGHAHPRTVTVTGGPVSLNLRGIVPACVVTFDADGRFDEAAYRRYLQWLLPQGPVALAINADTGEGPHLWPDEREHVLRVAVDEAGDRPGHGRPVRHVHRAGRRGGEARRGCGRRAACSSSRSRPTRARRSTRPCRSRITRRSRAAAGCRWSRSSSSRRWAG